MREAGPKAFFAWAKALHWEYSWEGRTRTQEIRNLLNASQKTYHPIMDFLSQVLACGKICVKPGMSLAFCKVIHPVSFCGKRKTEEGNPI